MKCTKMIQLLSAVTVTLILGAVANGESFKKEHPRRNEVNERVRDQRARIRQGLKNGTLTKAQAAAERKDLKNIKAQEHDDVKDNGGYITKSEQKQLNGDLNKNSKQIYGDKHPAPTTPAQGSN